MINLYEFGKGIRENRLNLEDADLRRIFEYFDIDNTGSIRYHDLLQALRGRMNDQRSQIVCEVFHDMDANKDGTIPISLIREGFNPLNHPDYLSRKKSPELIINDFIHQFDMHHAIYTDDLMLREKKVTLQSFLEFYDTVSALYLSLIHI